MKRVYRVKNCTVVSAPIVKETTCYYFIGKDDSPKFHYCERIKKGNVHLSAKSAVTTAADAAAITLEQCRLRYSEAAKRLRALDRLKESLENKPLDTKLKLL